MLQQFFILQNAHFTLNILAFFVFFAIFWLYLDAWLSKKNLQDTFKIIGFLIISLSFAVHATYVEFALINAVAGGSSRSYGAGIILEITGFILLIIGLVLDPLQKIPTYAKSDTGSNPKLLTFIPASVKSIISLPLAIPLLSFATSLLYLRRATIGLERHIKPVSLGFFILTLSQSLSLAEGFRDSTHVAAALLTRAFGTLWLIEHALLAFAIFILGRWVFHYLLRRIQTQLFIFFATFVLLIFLFTTVTFTTLLFNNLKQDAMNHLQTDVKILEYAVESKKSEILSDAQLVAQNPSLHKALIENDRKTIVDLTSKVLVSKKGSVLTVIAADGRVIARAQDPERFGDSISGDNLFVRAGSGQEVSSIVTYEGVLAPILAIRAAVPIRVGKDITGVVMVGTDIDNTFVDGVKKTTGLDTALYADDIRSASTFLAIDGKTRWIGIKEKDDKVRKQVLTEGKTYVGTVSVLNVPYFAAYAPLRDADTNPMGMMFVAKEQTSILQTAANSIKYTFVISVGLLLLSLIPAYLISRYIAYQVK